MTKSLPSKNLVLYADDDADDRELLTEAFSEFSSVIDLLTFDSGLTLLHFLDQRDPFMPSPCLIILDINMPLMDGKQVLQKIRMMEKFAEVPVVIFTTSTMPAEMAFAHTYHAGFVTKPLHAKQINQIIQQLIDHCTDDVKEKVRQQRGR